MSIGIWQIAIVVILVVLLFGRGKISSLMGDVAKDYMEQVALMKDEELAYDRSNWILKYGDGNGAFDENTYEVDIHTIAILIEQIRRFGRIIYHLSGKNVRLDNKQ